MFLHRAMRYYRLWIYSCNMVLLVSVLLFISLAAWVVSDFRVALFPQIDFRHPSLLYAYLALLLQAGALQAVGCAGALRHNERLLHAYWATMLALLCGDAVLGAVWLSRLSSLHATLRGDLLARLDSRYGDDPPYRLLWDRLQEEDRCCGVDGPRDFEATSWLAEERRGHPARALPRSCCRGGALASRENVTACVEMSSGELVHGGGCLEPLRRWLQRSSDALVVVGFCVVAFLKLCFVGILRYEIREMIQKIKVLRDMSESPGLLDPGGPAVLLPGPAMAAKLRRQRSSAAEPPPLPKQPLPPNGNNNDAAAAAAATDLPAKQNSSPV